MADVRKQEVKVVVRCKDSAKSCMYSNVMGLCRLELIRVRVTRLLADVDQNYTFIINFVVNRSWFVLSEQ